MLKAKKIRSVTFTIKMMGNRNARMRYHYAHESISVNYWEYWRHCEYAEPVEKTPEWDDNRLYEKKVVLFDFLQAVSVEVSTDNGKSWKAVMWTGSPQFRASEIAFNRRNSSLVITCRTMMGLCDYVYYFNTDQIVIPSLNNELLRDRYSHNGLTVEEYFNKTRTDIEK